MIFIYVRVGTTGGFAQVNFSTVSEFERSTVLMIPSEMDSREDWDK